MFGGRLVEAGNAAEGFDGDGGALRVRDDDGSLAAPLQSVQSFENPGLDEARADRTLDEDETIADRGGKEALRAEEHAA